MRRTIRITVTAAAVGAMVLSFAGTAAAQYTSPPDTFQNWHYHTTYGTRAACVERGNYLFNNGMVANDACVDHPSGPGADLWIIPKPDSEV
ncbi:hypothetical protein [Allorhizocola rhizosphaerae]|uniref:hypothetical protein n=1 Tax=Allorhizocola rhizosphaerae TaxID=1872709 RepID=UPI000E3C9500|nr:hypothetical protein [Allorhizocola rhizosphaerae]